MREAIKMLATPTSTRAFYGAYLAILRFPCQCSCCAYWLPPALFSILGPLSGCALLPSGWPCTLAAPGCCPTDSQGFLRPNFQTHLHLHLSSPLSTLDPTPASVNDFPHNKFFLFLYIQKKFSSLMYLPISIEI